MIASRISNIQAADNVHQGRLTAAGGAYDADKLMGIDVQGGMIQCPDPLIAHKVIFAKFFFFAFLFLFSVSKRASSLDCSGAIPFGTVSDTFACFFLNILAPFVRQAVRGHASGFSFADYSILHSLIGLKILAIHNKLTSPAHEGRGNILLQIYIQAGIHIDAIQRDSKVQMVSGGYSGASGQANLLTSADNSAIADAESA